MNFYAIINVSLATYVARIASDSCMEYPIQDIVWRLTSQESLPILA